MARARNIKPGFFRNEQLAELPFEYRLLFIGLWTLADREGRLEDRPKRIRMEVFPADDVNCEAGISALETCGLIVRYQDQGNAYIWIPTFLDHQKPHLREAASTIPPYQGQTKAMPRRDQGNAEAMASPADCLNPDCLNPESETSTQEVRGEAARKRARPLPVGFGISPAIREWAEQEGFSPYLDAHLAYFLDYAAAKRPTYADWDAAFRNAIRADWGDVRKTAMRTPVTGDAAVAQYLARFPDATH